MKFFLATLALLATAQAAAIGAERRQAPILPVDPVHLVPAKVLPSVVPGVPGDRPLNEPLPGAPALPLKGRQEAEATPIKADAPSASSTGKPTPTESGKPESPLAPLSGLIGGLGLPI